MKKTYISPTLAMYSLHTEQDVMLTMSANSSEGIDSDNEWDTNKKQPGFGGSMWDNMGETGNF